MPVSTGVMSSTRATFTHLPFFQKSGNLAAREIIGGWSVSGITSLETGSANNVSLTGVDTVGLGAGGNRPDLISPVVYLNPKASVNGGRPLLLEGLFCHTGNSLERQQRDQRIRHGPKGYSQGPRVPTL